MDSGTETKARGAQKYLILTCDTEALGPEAAEDHVNRLIWGRFPHAPYDAGVGLMMDIADEFGAKITFFLDTVEQTRYGSQIDEVAQRILAQGHDLQLHLHREFLPDSIWTQRGYLPPTWAMNMFNDASARIALEYAVETFVKMAGIAPKIYRPGAFRYNQSILRALKDFGFRQAHQYVATTALKASYPHGFDAGVLPVFRWSNGLIEIPVGCTENPPPRKGDRYAVYEFHAFNGLQDALDQMERFWSYGPQFNCLDMVLHSWAFLERGASGYYDWIDERHVNRFRELLGNLPADVRVITAGQLLEKIEAGEIEPAFDMPLCVAGTEAIPLYRHES